MTMSRIVLVGGFLGAGKTTLLAQATSRLAQRGKRIGLITNDQAPNLVDTAILEESRAAVEEVSGGCFCCRFDELVGAMDRLLTPPAPDVLLGEPVGSCTDLSATVLQPLKKHYRERFCVAPFSVLVDVKQVRTLDRLRESLDNAQSARFPDNVMYIYEKQLEEADVIVLNKADLLPRDELTMVEASLRENFPQAPVITISALNGAGVDGWLDHVMEARDAGRTIATVDYDEYAEGEAALGWLNATIKLHGDSNTDWKSFCVKLVRAAQREFQKVSAEIAHLKLRLAAGANALTANLTANHAEPFIQGEIEGSPTEAVMLLNLRAKIDPAPLKAITERCVNMVAGDSIQAMWEESQCFAPSRPRPTHRFTEVV